MRIVGKIAHWIEDETDSACEYAKCAIKLRDEGNSQAAQVLYEMASQEESHADRLHGIVVNMINRMKQEGVEVPQGMLDVWEWRHGELIEKMAHAKEMIALYSK